MIYLITGFILAFGVFSFILVNDEKGTGERTEISAEDKVDNA